MKLYNCPCPICGSSDRFDTWVEVDFDEKRLGEYSFASRKFPEFMNFRMVRCRICDLLYANPRPKIEWFIKAYEKAKYDSSEEAKYAAGTYARYLGRILPKIAHKAAALDIGTGNGAFLKHLIEAGFQNVIGIEPSLSPIEAADEHIRSYIKVGMFSPDDFQSNSFSLITCFQTIEHVEDPLSLCKGSYRLLKKGGAFFLVAHNYRALSAKFLRKKSPIYDVEHLQLHSTKSIRFMLEKAGFEVLKIHAIYNYYPIYYWLKLFPLGPGLKKKFFRIFKKGTLGSIALPFMAGNIAAVGRKQSQ